MQQADVVGQVQEAAKPMPPGAIQQHDGMGARCDVAADFDQMQVHRLGIGLGQHQGRADAT